MDMNSREIEVQLLDRELPTKVTVNNGWTAEYVSRMVAGKILGIKAIALEVKYSIVVTYKKFCRMVSMGIHIV